MFPSADNAKGDQLQKMQLDDVEGIKEPGYYEGGVDEDGQPHGEGTWLVGDEYYTGNFEHGRKSGRGTYKCDAYKEEGIFKDDMIVQGKVTFSNGDWYMKDLFSQGHFNGTGTYRWNELRYTYSGDFVMDKKNGNGRMVYDNGAVYQGTFVDNKMHGTIVYITPEGHYFTGNYDKGEKMRFWATLYEEW